jgi:hypothetical protein
MMRHHLGYKLALLGIVCTLAIFLFPGVSGPYPIVHGPVTALRAMRAWLLLLIALTLTLVGLAKFLAARVGLIFPFVFTLSPINLLQQSLILRC